MKLAFKTSGLCATGTTILVIYTGIVSHMEPLKVLMLSVGGFVLTGFLGYVLGEILSEADKNPNKAMLKKKGLKGKGAVEAPKKETTLTGDENFLDDLDSYESPGLPGGEPLEALDEDQLVEALDD